MPGNNAILVAYPINACYNTYAPALGLHFVKSTPINVFLRKLFNLTVFNGLIFDRVYVS